MFSGKGVVSWSAALGAAPAMAGWLDGGAAPGVASGAALEMAWAAAVKVAGFGALPSRCETVISARVVVARALQAL